MDFLRRPARFLKCLLAPAAVLAAICASPAQAQFGGAALAELARHDYLHRDILLFSQGLELDEYQRMILDSLFQDYHDRFNDGWQATQERIHELLGDIQGADREQILAMVMAPFDDWRQEKVQIKERFESDVRAILNPEQAKQWSAFQQRMTREKTMHLGRMAGESLNLFPLVRELQLDERTLEQLEPTLDQYSAQLHQALNVRNQILEDSQAEFIRSMRTQGAPSAQRNVRREISARVDVRNINLHYLQQLAEQLPPDVAAKFRDRALEVANPRVFRTMPAMRMFTRALELEDLEESTREAIEQLRDAFASELEQINANLHQVMLEYEPRQLQNMEELRLARQTGGSVERIEDATRKPLQDREERARHYVKQLQSLLSPEQLAEIPSGSRGGRATVTRGARDGRDANRARNAARDAIRQRSREAGESGTGSQGRSRAGERPQQGSGSTGPSRRGGRERQRDR